MNQVVSRRWMAVTSATLAPASDDDTLDAEPATAPRSAVATVLPLLLLLALYGALSFVNSPRAYLGTDTGGKVLTLDAMKARGSHTDLDVGYWAEEWDPAGELHGYYGTTPMDRGWIQVTSVPMMVAASPLYDAGGYRLALLLPMLGAVAAAAGARALARRFGGGDTEQRWAFWLVGLAGPVLIYALDLWEHTLGLAAMAWALLAALAARDRRGLAVIAPAVAAGFLWGVGFSMRTEALLYGAVMTAVVLATMVPARRWRDGLALGVATVAGLAAALGANLALERVVLGSSFRAGRAGGAADAAGAGWSTRLREGLVTTVGSGGSDQDIFFGLVAVVMLGLLVHRGRVGSASTRLPMLAIAAAVPIGLRYGAGLGFLPGLLVTTPLAVAGLVAGRRGPNAPLVWAAVGALPLVWAFQYVGGAVPQWGGRYVLFSGLVLTAAGVAALPGLLPVVRRTLVTAAILVTVLGLAWMSVRTHAFARAGDRIAGQDDPVLIAEGETGFVPREFVAANGGRRWLATNGSAQLGRAASITSRAGFDRFGVLLVAERTPPARIGRFTLTGTTEVPLLDGTTLRVAHYST